MLNGLFMASTIHRAYRQSIDSNVDAAQAASRKASEATARTDGLKQDIDKLYMITEALWTLLKEQHGYDDEVLGRLIESIDMRSGRIDGKRERKMNPACPTCHRVVIGNHNTCLYCGTAVERELF